MAPTRILSKTLALLFTLAALFAPSALATEGISPAKSLGGDKTTTTTATTSAKPSGAAGTKETLSIATAKPGNGTTVSGTIAWEVTVLAGSPSKV
jgi:hypothetical protein